MDMIGRIRRMYSRGKKSEREIARTTGLSRNTIAKWLHGPLAGEPKYRRGEPPRKLSAFHEVLVQALKADAHRPRHERRTARALHAQIKAAGYEGGYTRVTDFIRAWRQGEGQSVASTAFVPLAFELGEAFQFDWSEEGLVVGGIYRRMQVSHLKLCASRAFWLVAYPSQGHEMLFDAHTRSFAALGGVARRGIYYNMKTAVDKVSKGKGRIVNARFAVMCAHYLFDADFCNVASGWEKGGGREERAGQPPAHLDCDAAQRRFGGFVELNAWLGERCRALWEEIRHPEHKQFSVAEMLEHERAACATRTHASGRTTGHCDGHSACRLALAPLFSNSSVGFHPDVLEKALLVAVAQMRSSIVTCPMVDQTTSEGCDGTALVTNKNAHC